MQDRSYLTLALVARANGLTGLREDQRGDAESVCTLSVDFAARTSLACECARRLTPLAFALAQPHLARVFSRSFFERTFNSQAHPHAHDHADAYERDIPDLARARIWPDRAARHQSPNFSSRSHPTSSIHSRFSTTFHLGFDSNLTFFSRRLASLRNDPSSLKPHY